MAKKIQKTSLAEFEKAAEKARKKKYLLRLYVSGVTPKSQRAIKNIKRFCEEHLAGRCDLEIIDIYQQPGLASDEQLVALPTLIKKLPLPLRKIIGDLSDVEEFLVGIDVKTKKED